MSFSIRTHSSNFVLWRLSPVCKPAKQPASKPSRQVGGSLPRNQKLKLFSMSPSFGGLHVFRQRTLRAPHLSRIITSSFSLFPSRLLSTVYLLSEARSVSPVLWPSISLTLQNIVPLTQITNRHPYSGIEVRDFPDVFLILAKRNQ